MGGPIKTVFIFYWSEQEGRKDGNATCSALEIMLSHVAQLGFEVEGISSDNAGNLKVSFFSLFFVFSTSFFFFNFLSIFRT